MADNPQNFSDLSDEFRVEASTDQGPHVGFGDERSFANDAEREEFERRAEDVRRREQQRLDETNEALREEQDAARQRNTAESSAAAEDPQTYQSSLWQNMADRHNLKLADKGNYFNLKPDQKKMQDQVRVAILRAVYEKNAKTIYFYNAKNQIDSTMTSLADDMLNKMKRHGIVPMDVQISGSRMDGPEPWLTAWGRMRRDTVNEKYDMKNAKAARRSYGEANGWGDGLSNAFAKEGNVMKDMQKHYGSKKIRVEPNSPDASSNNISPPA